MTSLRPVSTELVVKYMLSYSWNYLNYNLAQFTFSLSLLDNLGVYLWVQKNAESDGYDENIVLTVIHREKKRKMDD